MKQFILFVSFLAMAVSVMGQDPTEKERKQAKKEKKRQKIESIIRQEEEGVLVYRKQSIFGVQLRNNGYGMFYEIGRMKTPRRTNLYHLGFDEIKHVKEEKFSSGGIFSNPFIYGKINNFYSVKLGIGQQYILGQKGNRNGVAVAAVATGGLSLGLLRPYYLRVVDLNNAEKEIKYDDDSTLFLSDRIIGGAGLGKGWGEMKLKPGAFLKTGLRFDYGRFNETVTALEAGVCIEFYASKIPIMALQKDKNLFFQGYIAIEFGRRK